jgi:hypothetical protein
MLNFIELNDSFSVILRMPVYCEKEERRPKYKSHDCTSKYSVGCAFVRIERDKNEE